MTPEEYVQNAKERGESRRELEQAVAEAVLVLLEKNLAVPVDYDIAVGAALTRYRKCRGI